MRLPPPARWSRLRIGLIIRPRLRPRLRVEHRRLRGCRVPVLIRPGPDFRAGALERRAIRRLRLEAWRAFATLELGASRLGAAKGNGVGLHNNAWKQLTYLLQGSVDELGSDTLVLRAGSCSAQSSPALLAARLLGKYFGDAGPTLRRRVLQWTCSSPPSPSRRPRRRATPRQARARPTASRRSARCMKPRRPRPPDKGALLPETRRATTARASSRAWSLLKVLA